MQHLNFSRQLMKHCQSMIEIPGLEQNKRQLFGQVMDLHGASTKFMLPKGGRLFDDFQFKALDENEPLRLPYPYIALEYESNQHERGSNEKIGTVQNAPMYEDDSFVHAPKRVIYARERGNWVVVTIAFWVREDGTWRILPECALPRTGFLDRTQEVNGRTPFKVATFGNTPPTADYLDELGSLMCFLNVLQCSNVQITRSDPKNAGKKIKSAHQFDSYHILTIDATNRKSNGVQQSCGGGRSPREHLRRGHIRRLEDGRRIWVNATVVAAGKGAGTIKKDYALKC